MTTSSLVCRMNSPPLETWFYTAREKGVPPECLTLKWEWCHVEGHEQISSTAHPAELWLPTTLHSFLSLKQRSTPWPGLQNSLTDLWISSYLHKGVRENVDYATGWLTSCVPGGKLPSAFEISYQKERGRLQVLTVESKRTDACV